MVFLVIPVSQSRSVEEDGTKKTATLYLGALRRLQERLPEDAVLSDVTEEKASQHLHSLQEEGITKKTIQRHLTSLRSYWRFLKERKVWNEDPWAEIRLKRGKRASREGQRRAFTETELVVLLTGKAPPYLRDLMVLGLYTGARLEELCTLMRGDVTDGCLRLSHGDYTGKTDAARRVVPAHSLILPTVERLVAHADPETGRLFPSLKKGGPDQRYSHYTTKVFTRYRRSVGVDDPKTVFHSFRKNAANALERGGVPESTAALIIGHARPTMTYGLYSSDGLPKEHLREAVETMTYGEKVDRLVLSPY